MHDLCQPLATLQCRLEFAQMMGDDAAYRRAVEGALVDCVEVNDRLTTMRSVLATTMPRDAKREM